MPGVEFMRSAESALTATSFRSEFTARIEFFAALIMGLLVIASRRIRPVTLVAVGGLFASVLIGTSWYFYSQHGS